MVLNQVIRRSCGQVIPAQYRGQDRPVTLVVVAHNPTS
jgi:hypothetical protein